MSSSATIQEKRSNARGCDTETNLALSTDSRSYGVANKSLSTTSSTVQEKDSADVVIDRVHDSLVDISLWLEIGVQWTKGIGFYVINWITTGTSLLTGSLRMSPNSTIHSWHPLNLSQAFPPVAKDVIDERSEEHTSELQSQTLISYAVFCLNMLALEPFNGLELSF